MGAGQQIVPIASRLRRVPGYVSFGADKTAQATQGRLLTLSSWSDAYCLHWTRWLPHVYSRPKAPGGDRFCRRWPWSSCKFLTLQAAGSLFTKHRQSHRVWETKRTAKGKGDPFPWKSQQKPWLWLCSWGFKERDQWGKLPRGHCETWAQVIYLK